MNQAQFSKVLVGDDGTIEGVHSPEYELVLHNGVRDEAEATRRERHRGTNDDSSTMRSTATDRSNRSAETIHGSNQSSLTTLTETSHPLARESANPPCRARPRIARTSVAFAGRGSREQWLVGEGGLEPQRHLIWRPRRVSRGHHHDGLNFWFGGETVVIDR